MQLLLDRLSHICVRLRVAPRFVSRESLQRARIHWRSASLLVAVLVSMFQRSP